MAAVTAIALQLVFTALGFAIGATVAEASTTGAAEGGNIGFAAGAWWLITGTISLLVGGLTLGRMSGIPRGTNLLLAALAVWAVTAVFGFFVVWSGMMSAASSPLAAMSTPGVNTAAIGQSSATGSEFATGGAGATAGGDSATAQQAQEAARTASWWTVIGMLIGAGVTMGGAWMSAPKTTVLVAD
ncbi:MAG: hypothetical protein EA378_08950 [Phycisphaerales bacterium]|nr:MAG: hypothetical protein EA378_08950 [Phycisphaerales bacterium]